MHPRRRQFDMSFGGKKVRVVKRPVERAPTPEEKPQDDLAIALHRLGVKGIQTAEITLPDGRIVKGIIARKGFDNR